MTPTQFSKLYPKLYHLTFASNLEGIRANGLQSAAALADLHAFDPSEREATLDKRRLCIQTLHGVTLRDQHTAPDAKMKSCLVKITIPEWFALLNSKTFFFLSRDKALRLAETYSAYENLLLEVDTAKLLATHARHTTLCRINPGGFLYNPRPRGRASFIPLADFAYKNKRDTPAELTIDTPIPNILDFSVLHPIKNFPA